MTNADHSKSLSHFEKFYIPTYTWANCIAGKFIDTPHWKIFPIELVHNVKCFGFYIYSKIDKKKILYCTDTKFLPKINGEIDVAIIDCNYCDEYVYELMYKGVEVGIGYKNHCSIETVQEWLQGRNDKISYFVAYHLSNSGLTTPQIIKDKIGNLVGNLIMSAPNTTFEV